MIVAYTEKQYIGTKSNDKLCLICEYCGNRFNKLKKLITQVVIGTKPNDCKYCSKECQSLSRTTYSDTSCANCNTAIKVVKSELKQNNFCSRSCSASYFNKFRKVTKLCIQCKSEIITRYGKLNRLFCSKMCASQYKKQSKIQDWLSGKTSGSGVGGCLQFVRNYMLEQAGYKCSQCGWAETNQYSNTIPIEIDHINGDYKNNRPENLRVLCPNCHALTPTYRMLNRRSKDSTVIKDRIIYRRT